MASRFYSPLNPTKRQIRLIHLAPAIQAEDEIVCHLSLASLTKISNMKLYRTFGATRQIHFRSEYMASHQRLLSSAFQRLRLKKRAQAPSVTSQSVSVTKNLYSALKHLRLRDKVRVLWIDALCINQSDLDERSHQVLHMSSIFGRAVSVVVWLGEAWEGSDLAMEVVQRLGQDENLHLDRSLSPSLIINGVGLDSEDLCENLARFFNLPWWKRIWTIQEFVLARHVVVQCGQRVLSGKLLFKFRKHLMNHLDTCCLIVNHQWNALKKSVISVHNIIIIVHSLELTQTRREEMDFLFILAMFRNCQSTDDRDRIYGMLSLASNFFFQPDYTLSGPQVFENFAIAIVSQTGNLDVLAIYLVREV